MKNRGIVDENVDPIVEREAALHPALPIFFKADVQSLKRSGGTEFSRKGFPGILENVSQQKRNVGQERECPTPAFDSAPPPSPPVKWPNHLNLRTEASGGQHRRPLPWDAHGNHLACETLPLRIV